MSVELELPELTDEQKEAVARVTALLRTRRQVLLSGAAGTGKTTLVRAVPAALGLRPFSLARFLREGGGTQHKSYLAAAYTKRAAQQLVRKGVFNARTIHSVAYSPVLNQARNRELLATLNGELERRTEEADILKAQPEPRDDVRLEKLAREIMSLHRQIEDAELPDFSFSPDALRQAGLLIVDESSMVNTEMAAELLSAGTRILWVGDSAQLPPVEGDEFFAADRIDVRLRTVMRQKAGSSLLEYARGIREGGGVRHGSFGDVEAAPQRQAGRWLEKNLDAALDGFVITDTNDLRKDCNRLMRALLGRKDWRPVKGDRLVVLRNTGRLATGDVLELGGVEWSERHRIFFCDGAARLGDGGGPVARFAFYAKQLPGPYVADGAVAPSARAVDSITVPVVPVDWGYAITCHKAQGSERELAAVISTGWMCGEHRRRWLYTALTRARSQARLFCPEIPAGESLDPF